MPPPSSDEHDRRWQDKVVNRLDKIIVLLKQLAPRKATSLGAAYHLTPHTRITRSLAMATIPVVGALFDKVDVVMTLTPNGPLDGVPTWTNNGNGTLAVADGGLSATLVHPDETGVIDVHVEAAVDNPDTPEIEVVSADFTGSWSHSKATDLGASASLVAF